MVWRPRSPKPWELLDDTPMGGSSRPMEPMGPHRPRALKYTPTGGSSRPGSSRPGSLRPIGPGPWSPWGPIWAQWAPIWVPYGPRGSYFDLLKVWPHQYTRFFMLNPNPASILAQNPPRTRLYPKYFFINFQFFIFDPGSVLDHSHGPHMGPKGPHI